MSSATHQVLACPDLLDDIFSWLHPPSRSIGEHLQDYAAERSERDALRKVLFSAAFVCQAFSWHALDELWSTLDDLDPLLSLLPSFEYDANQQICLLSRPVEPGEWQCLALYARRVRAPHHDSRHELRIHQDVWKHISDYYRDVPMLPRLERLVLRDLDITDIRTLPVVLSPAVRYLTISFYCGVTTTPSAIKLGSSTFLNVITTVSLDLRTLHLNHAYFLIPSSFQTLRGLTKVFELHLCRCRQCAVEIPRSLGETVPPTLRVLVLAVRDIPEGFEMSCLQSLEMLDIHGTSGDLERFIRGIWPSQLRTIKLLAWRDPAFDQAVPPPHLSSILASLPSTLRRVDLNLDIDSTPYPPCELSAIVAAMSPGPLQDLTDFTLHGGPTPILMSADAIRRLGELCPLLRSLNITQYPGLYAPASVTPRGLAEVARHFPMLESLPLPRLEAAELLSPDVDIPETSHGLRRIEFWHVYGVSDSHLAARAIARLFPHLRIDPSVDMGVLRGDWHGEWKHVRAVLCELLSAKREKLLRSASST